MKLSAPMVMAGFLSILPCSTNATGQDCNTIEIHEGHVAEDVLKNLHCLDQRIKKLEDRDGISRNIIVNPPTRDAGDFTATVSGASKDDNEIHISVGIHNKTSAPIFIALKGSPSLKEQSTGKSKSFRGSQTISSIGTGDTNENDYTPIPSSDNCTLNFTFSSDRTQENAFNLDLSLWRLGNGRISQLPIVPLNFVIK